MSRAFVKEDGREPEEPGGRLPSGRTNYVTPRGRALLEEKVRELSDRRAGLLAGKNPGEARPPLLDRVERDLAYYEGQLKRSVLVDNRGLKAQDIRFGAAVTVRDGKGEVREYFIVGEDEADAASGRLNWASPLAALLLGSSAGSAVSLRRGAGELRLEIVSVRYPV